MISLLLRRATAFIVAWSFVGSTSIKAQTADDMLKSLEPGIGYSRFKQWATDNKMVFESFTKDQLTVRDQGVRQGFSLRIFVHFCGGDDYSGRASSLTIQQVYASAIDALVAVRNGVDQLDGPPVEARYPGQFTVRRDRPDSGATGAGIAFAQESEKGNWELGLFSVSNDAFLLQIVRRKDAICG